MSENVGSQGPGQPDDPEMRVPINFAELLPSFHMPAVENLQRLQREREEWGEEMSRISESIADANAETWEREEAQANATLEIAAVQKRLEEMQAQALELAKRMAAATAEVAGTQQAVLASINEELAVLRGQHDTLREQSVDQKHLIRSGWASGVVMEWTLFVATIAAMSTVLFALQPARQLDWWFWLPAATACTAAAAGLGVWQRRRRPGD